MMLGAPQLEDMPDRVGAGQAPYVLGGEELTVEVTERVVTAALARAEQLGSRPLDELVYETLYCEHGRLDRANGDPRAASDRAFLGWLRQELAHSDEPRRRALVRAIVHRYAREITGHFDPRVYRIATRVVPPRAQRLSAR